MVTLLGEGITVDELAHHFGTIGYEVLTSLGHRYARVYKGGNVVEPLVKAGARAGSRTAALPAADRAAREPAAAAELSDAPVPRARRSAPSAMRCRAGAISSHRTRVAFWVPALRSSVTRCAASGTRDAYFFRLSSAVLQVALS